MSEASRPVWSPSIKGLRKMKQAKRIDRFMSTCVTTINLTFLSIFLLCGSHRRDGRGSWSRGRCRSFGSGQGRSNYDWTTLLVTLEWNPAWDLVYSQGLRERGLLHDSDGKSTHYCEFPTSRHLELKEYPDGQSDDCNIHENIYASGNVPECRLLDVLASFLLAHALRLNQNVKTDLIEAFIRYDSPRSRRGALRGNGDHGNQRPKEIHSHISHLCSATDLSNNN